MPESFSSPSTRDRILSYLQEHPVTSVQSLSRAWGLTRADIRYHLNGLVQDGFVEVLPRETGKPIRRGRPEREYRLAYGSTPDNLPLLCQVLLSLLPQLAHPDDVETLPGIIAERMAAGYLPGASAVQRYSQAIEHLNRQGYLARWEAGPAGPRIQLRNCPYRAILDSYPVLCTIDRLLLERLVQAPLQQTARINPWTGKPAACVFLGGRPFSEAVPD